MGTKVKFIAADPRDVPMPDGTVVTVAKGDEIETDAAHAKALARQAGVWEAVADKPAPKKGKED